MHRLFLPGPLRAPAQNEHLGPIRRRVLEEPHILLTGHVAMHHPDPICLAIESFHILFHRADIGRVSGE